MKLIRSAKIVIIDADNKALLLRRSETHPRDPSAPDLPGGVIEDNETVEAGVLRELQEETGLEIDQASITLLHNLTFNNIPGISISRRLYAARIAEASPNIVLSSEHDEYRWVAIPDLKKLEKPYQHSVEYANQHHLWEAV